MTNGLDGAIIEVHMKIGDNYARCPRCGLEGPFELRMESIGEIG